MYCKRYRFIVAAAAVVCLFFIGEGVLIADDDACEKYMEIAQAVVSSKLGEDSFLNDLINVPDGRDWMAEFPDDCMAESLKDDNMEKLNINEPRVGVCRGETSLFRYNKADGEVKYLNRARAFIFGQSPRQAATVDLGLETIIPFVEALNMPYVEWNLKVFNTVVMGGAMGSVDGGRAAEPEETFEAERHFRFRRAIGGYDGVPVLGSKFFAAVSNNAEIAKVSIRWPQFIIDPRIKDRAKALSRETIVAAVFEELVNDNGQCEEIASFKGVVVYAPEKMDLTGDGDQPDLQSQTQPSSRSKLHLETTVYRPKLLVSVLPASLEEGGRRFLVELLTLEDAESAEDDD